MNLMHQMNEWSNRHHPKWLVLLRVVLGLCLFIKGIGFIQNTALLTGILSQTYFSKNASWLSSFIPWLHLLGGCMILAGLFTRFWSLVQIPILLGAVFFVNARQRIFVGESDFLFSVIVLILLVFFFIEGGGPISLDNYFSKYLKSKER